MRLIGAYGSQDGLTLATKMHIGSDCVTADLLDSPKAMKAIG
jgi:hypothetical protein